MHLTARYTHLTIEITNDVNKKYAYFSVIYIIYSKDHASFIEDSVSVDENNVSVNDEDSIFIK